MKQGCRFDKLVARTFGFDVVGWVARLRRTGAQCLRRNPTCLSESLRGSLTSVGRSFRDNGLEQVSDSLSDYCSQLAAQQAHFELSSQIVG